MDSSGSASSSGSSRRRERGESEGNNPFGKSPNPFAGNLITSTQNPFYRPVIQQQQQQRLQGQHLAQGISNANEKEKEKEEEEEEEVDGIKDTKDQTESRNKNRETKRLKAQTSPSPDHGVNRITMSESRKFMSSPGMIGREIRVNEAILPFAVCASLGDRRTMEDRYCVVGSIGNDPKASMYAVFDGHGGKLAADYCYEEMHKHIAETVLNEVAALNGTVKELADFIPSVDSLKRSFHATDEAFCKKNPKHFVGSTALIMLVRETKIWIAHVGDSRALLIRSDGTHVALTTDHKPNNPVERQRIEAAGGSIFDNRVDGILAMSRAIGDQNFKRFVIPEPDVFVFDSISSKRNDDDVTDAFIILASDGLWDSLTPEEASQIVLSSSSLESRANLLTIRALDAARLESSSGPDNIVVLVLDLKNRKDHHFSMIKPNVIDISSFSNNNILHSTLTPSPTGAMLSEQVERLKFSPSHSLSQVRTSVITTTTTTSQQKSQQTEIMSHLNNPNQTKKKGRPSLTLDVRDEHGNIPGAAGGYLN